MIKHVTASLANGRIKLVAYPEALCHRGVWQYKPVLEIWNEGSLIQFKGYEIDDLMVFLTLIKAGL